MVMGLELDVGSRVRVISVAMEDFEAVQDGLDVVVGNSLFLVVEVSLVLLEVGVGVGVVEVAKVVDTELELVVLGVSDVEVVL